MQSHPAGPLHVRPKLTCLILFKTLPEKLPLSLLLLGLMIIQSSGGCASGLLSRLVGKQLTLEAV